MAEEVVRASADVSDLVSQLAQAQQALLQHVDDMQRVADSYVKLTKTSRGVTGSFRAVTDEGERVTGRLKSTADGFNVLTKSIASSINSLKEFNAEQVRANANKGAVGAGTLTAEAGLLQNVPGQFQAQAIRAQQQLARALASDPNALAGPAIDIITRLQDGARDIEIGVRGKIQNAWLAVLSVQQRVNDSLKEQKSNTSSIAEKAAKIASAQNAARSTVQQFFESNKITAEGAPSNLQAQLQSAQTRLSKAIQNDFSGGFEELQRMAKAAQTGAIQYGDSINSKVFAALQRVLIVWEQIQKKAADAGKVSGGPIDQNQLNTLRSGITGAFPVPSGASTSAIISYQNAINNLIAVASRGQIPLDQFVKIFNQVQRNPAGDFAGASEGLQKVQGAAQRVKLAYETMANSAKNAEDSGTRAGRNLFVSFDQFMRILEIQVIHRVFGALVTGMQNAIGAAAELQVKISEIRTISQASGISFREFQEIVRQTSEAFNQPQVQVAEALYQGFSNQVIRTRSDMGLFNEVMRFSRIAVTDASSAMNLISSVLTAYNLSASNARQVSDELFKAIEIGRFRASDLANSFGRVTVVSSQVGVSLEETLGLMTSLTRVGVSPAEAMTQVSAIMQSIINPSEQLKNLFHSWGVESGFAAVQTLGFVEVLRRISAEGNRIGQVLPNVRAIRGVLGAAPRGGVSILQEDIREIQDARGSAEEAARIVGESAGDAFRKEAIKIQNFFLNDFANPFIATIHKLTEPFGGISETVKSVGNAIISLSSVIAGFIALTTQLVTLWGVLPVNLGTVIQLYAAYKAAVIGVSLATQLLQAYEASLAAAKLAVAAASSAETAAELAQAQATIVEAAAKTGETTAEVANAAAKIENVVATTTLTGAQYAAAASSGILTAAMNAIPFVAIVTLIAYLVGAFDPLLDKFNSFKNRIAELQTLEQGMTRRFAEERQRRERDSQDSQNSFQSELTAVSQAWNRALAAMRVDSDRLANAQKALVERTTENLRISVHNISDGLKQSVQDLERKVNEATNNIRNSFKQQMAFADRDASTMFQHAIRAAGRQPELISGGGVNTQDVRQMQQIAVRLQQQSMLAAAQQNTFAQQRQIIAGRIRTLEAEAATLTARGDADSMASARRKYAEIRHLTEQDFDIQTQAGHSAAKMAAEAAAAFGGSVIATYAIPLADLERRIQRITAMEQAAEEQFRRMQSDQQARDQDALQKARRQQEEVNRAMNALLNFQVRNNQGNIAQSLLDPKDPNNERVAQRFQERWAEMIRNLQAAMQGANLNPLQQSQLMSNLTQQRLALEGQLEREVVNNSIRMRQEQIEQMRQQIQQLDADARRFRNEARNTQNEALPAVTRQVQAMLDVINRATPTEASTIFQPDQRAILNAVTPAVRRFTEAQLALNKAMSDFEAARGTDREAAAMESLQQRLREVGRAYDDFLRARFGAQAAVTQSTTTGELVTAPRDQLTRLAQDLKRSQEQLATAERDLKTARERLDGMSAALVQLPGRYREAAAGLGEFGAAAAANLDNANKFADAIGRIADQIQRIRDNPLPPLQLPQAPPAAAPRGGFDNFISSEDFFAEGGLIGGRFNSFGPDNRIIAARDGEMVIRPDATRRFYSQLVAMNAGKIPHFAGGGVVNNSSTGDITINVNGSRNPEQTARAVMAKIKREQRRGNGRI